MEEQNILTGNMTCLNQIKSDIKAHNSTKEKFESIKVTVKELEKSIESSEKVVKEEVESTLKTRREAVELGFNKEIESDQEKLKKIQSDRDKAKSKGVKERIAVETSSLREDNKGMKDEIKVAFKSNKIPGFCNTRLFLALFMTKGIKDIFICLVTFLISFLALPSAIYYFVPNMKDWSLIVIYIVIVGIAFVTYKIISENVKFAHFEIIQGLVITRGKMSENKRKINKIVRSIKKDKNEEMYGLDRFDEKINMIISDIEKFEAKKSLALEDFNNLVKPNIIEEIESKDRDRIKALKVDLENKNSLYTETEDKVKEQRIFIASNYEAYLGNEFIMPDKLEALAEIINTGGAETIGKAMAVYKTRK